LTGAILLTGGKYIGVPYVHGGTTSSGFDCSGFVQKVYAENGITIPRTTSGIRNAGTVTTTPKPGDIMYWSAGHVALYVAPGWRLDANRPGSTVQIRPSYGNPIYLTF
jgi:cell wall-associated NlpC family hydrolase